MYDIRGAEFFLSFRFRKISGIDPANRRELALMISKVEGKPLGVGLAGRRPVDS